MFEVRSLAFAYGREPVLRDVSFVVSPGETVSVVGANGVGKTTLMRILATLSVPDAGQVIFDGQDIFRAPLRYRRQLGYLPEHPALYEDMSVKEYLFYRAELKGEPAKRIRRRLGEAAEICRIGSELLRSPVRHLSTGVRKRVALADAILLRPRVLVLDDLTAELDSSFRDSIAGILREAAAFSSVIVSGHDIEELARWSTRVLVLREGAIAASVQAAGVDASSVRGRLELVLKGEGA